MKVMKKSQLYNIRFLAMGFALMLTGCTMVSYPPDSAVGSYIQNFVYYADVDNENNEHAAEAPEKNPEKPYNLETVSYLGPEGTYTQEACERFFDKQYTFLPCETVWAAVEALICGASDFAVIPQENTIGGAVIDYVDVLIAQTEVSVAGEVELPINQNLLALPGTTLNGIKKVYSHKQGIAQGREWMNEHIPEAEVIEVSSTAEGARMVSEEKDQSCAAIASAACAGVYGLEILAESIQNNDSNKTRFYVLSKDEPSSGPAERLAFIATGSSKDLPALMSEIEDQDMTLVTIHDRPRKTELGEYRYLIECSGSSYEDYKKLEDTGLFELHFLGCFDVK